MRQDYGTFYALTGSGNEQQSLTNMKTPPRGSAADSLIQYLNTHTAILTDQGVNVRAFIERLSALQCSPPPASPAPAAAKSRSRKKSIG